jgi:uncharacterized protein YegP (UPF0339 family)
MSLNYPRSIASIVIIVAATVLPLHLGHAAADTPAPERKPKATFEVYQDKGGEYRWRLRAQNTKVLATSSDGYKEKRSCIAAIESVKRDVADAPVVELPQTDAPSGKSEPAK